ncbi:MAG: hypothetical protein A2X08_16050 [Bacteroidetes bacterium GWA2_32_17]|nr:MAG: hypothetical protein A2X08_16050 [Bacteroidetes bacterium GWA2_32_17]
MKKIITIIAALLFVSIVAVSQDTLYIYKSGTVVYQRAVSAIDSIIFYQVASNPFICGTSTITDINSNTYNTVSIGGQCWMKENLKTTKYSDNTAIPNITNSTTWSNLSTGAYCNYSNTPSNANTYGRLYNWYAVTDTHNICPTGWHVPSDAEWTTLTTYLGGESVAGGKLKETGTTHWQSPNAGATNETGFTALPGGNRYDNGAFYSLGSYGFWWSSTESTTDVAWNRGMSYNLSNVDRGSSTEVDGFSVRCVKD